MLFEHGQNETMKTDKYLLPLEKLYSLQQEYLYICKLLTVSMAVKPKTDVMEKWNNQAMLFFWDSFQLKVQ